MTLRTGYIAVIARGMRVAIMHDYLNQWGGAEQVLLTLLELFPKADIYTLLYDEKKTAGKFAGRVKKTSFLDFPLARNHHRVFIPLMPLGARTLRVPDKYDLIIYSTAGFAKGISYSKHTPHISYCLTPLRYAWEEKEYLQTLLPLALRILAKPFLAYLRRWDYWAAQKPDIILADSNFIKEKIKKYYGCDARVVYPPVDMNIFYEDNTLKKQNSYFLAVGRLLHYKRFDLIVRAFQELYFPLLIVGNGPEESSLKQLAANNPHIKFLPFVNSQHELQKLYSNARALIFPQVEDFGLVAAEAAACGTPIIAYNAGGAKEIVTESSGILFNEQTPENLALAVKQFILKEKSFDSKRIAAEAKKFSKENFLEGIRQTIK